MSAGTLTEILCNDDLGRPVLGEEPHLHPVVQYPDIPPDSVILLISSFLPYYTMCTDIFIGQIVGRIVDLSGIAVNFQNGTLASNKLTELKCGLYTNEQERLIATVASNKTVYSGNISRDEALQQKKKRKLNIDETPRTKQIADLHKYFGSKRTKMVTEQQERLKVDVENIKETLEQTAKETHIDESDVVSFKPDESDSLYRPPINRNASRVQDIYPLHVLIPSKVLEELTQSSKIMLDTDENELTLCDFVKREFIKLQKSESSERVTKAQILLYIDCLVNLVKQPARSVNLKRFSTCSYSPAVNKYLLDNFTLMSANGRTRPFSMRDKGVCYILVLSMLVFNNAIDLEIFTKDLKLGAKKLQDISKVLGFSFKSSDKNRVTLSLPVPQPVVASSGKKRGD